MSAAFKLAKKKVSQHDLRKLMAEQKKNARSNSEQDEKKIDSPFAKYDDHDQLSCQLCKKKLTNANIWRVHINSKQHKENIAKAKQLKEKLEQHVKTPKERVADMRKEQKLKGILKNSLSTTYSANPDPENTSNGNIKEGSQGI